MIISIETLRSLEDIEVIKNLKLSNTKLSKSRLQDLQVILSKKSFGCKQVFSMLTTINKNVKLDKSNIGQIDLLRILSDFDNSQEFTVVTDYVAVLSSIYSTDQPVMSSTKVLELIKEHFHQYKLDIGEIDANDARAIKVITCLLYYFISNKESVSKSIGCREFYTMLYSSSFLCYSLSF